MPALELVPPIQVDPLRVATASLRGVASHQSAAATWGIDLARDGEQLHVTVARGRSRARRAGVRVHRCDLLPSDVTVREGLPVTSPLRTAVDLARTLPRAEAVAAVDSVLRARLVTLPQLAEAVAALRPSRGRPQCREVLALVDPLSGSVLESLLRVLLDDAGLRPFETQYAVRAGRTTVGRVDFAWPQARLVVEADGFAFHADRERYRSDRRRGNALVVAGWQVLRFSWEDVTLRPATVVGQVRAALAR